MKTHSRLGEFISAEHREITHNTEWLVQW